VEVHVAKKFDVGIVTHIGGKPTKDYLRRQLDFADAALGPPPAPSPRRRGCEGKSRSQLLQELDALESVSRFDLPRQSSIPKMTVRQIQSQNLAFILDELRSGRSSVIDLAYPRSIVSMALRSCGKTENEVRQMVGQPPLSRDAETFNREQRDRSREVRVTIGGRMYQG
jgi:hypothetical protein